MNIARVFCCLLMVALLVPGCGYQEAQLQSFVEKEKQTLPKILFADVNVIDMEAGADELIYYCESPKLEPQEVEAAKKQMSIKAENFVKKNKLALAQLIDNEIKMVFVGRTADSEETFQLVVEPWKL